MSATHYSMEASWYACVALRKPTTASLGGGRLGAGLGAVLPLTAVGF